MAERRFRSQFRLSWEAKSCELFAKVTFGSSGAPTLNYGTGINTIVRNSAGKYTITLSDKYVSLLMANKMMIVASGAPAAPDMYVVADSSASATPTIQIQFDSAGTATDPASGEIALLQLVMRDSSVH